MSQSVLLSLLKQINSEFSKRDLPAFLGQVRHSLEGLSETQLAHFYVDMGYLQTVLVFLEEQHWLKRKPDPKLEIVFAPFIESFVNMELSPLKFVHEFLKSLSLRQLKAMKEPLQGAEVEILRKIKSLPFGSQKQFSTEVLALMSDLFERESVWQQEKEKVGEHLGLSMYRTYDSMDEIFDLNYALDRHMKTEIYQSERLYEGAGVGVQSGYSTVLTALKNLNPVPGARFVDLGSGYGRLGVVIGLLRPDIEFKGYEYVAHRVEIAKTTVKNLELQQHVQFYTQDLSSKEFTIPDAEIYYLYDPFSEDTYRHVLEQLVSVSARQKISIATKGNAKGWLEKTAKQQGWPLPEEFDRGNLCLFHSR